MEEKEVSLTGGSINQINPTTPEQETVQIQHGNKSYEIKNATSPPTVEIKHVKAMVKKFEQLNKPQKANDNSHLAAKQRKDGTGISRGNIFHSPIPKKPRPPMPAGEKPQELVDKVRAREAARSVAASKSNLAGTSQAVTTESPLPKPPPRRASEPTQFQRPKGTTPPPLPTQPSPPATEWTPSRGRSDSTAANQNVTMGSRTPSPPTQPSGQKTPPPPPPIGDRGPLSTATAVSATQAEKPSEEAANAERKLGFIMKEIQTTEETYGKHLSALLDVAQKMQKSEKEEIKAFGKTLDKEIRPLLVYANQFFQSDFKSNMETKENKTNIEKAKNAMAIYKKHTQVYFNKIADFVPKMEVLNAKMKNLEDNPELKEDMTKILELLRQQSGLYAFTDLTITPVQRGPRHELLLKDLVDTFEKTLDPNVDNRALKEQLNLTYEEVHTGAKKVNELKRQSDMNKAISQVLEGLASKKPTQKVNVKGEETEISTHEFIINGIQKYVESRSEAKTEKDPATRIGETIKNETDSKKRIALRVNLAKAAIALAKKEDLASAKVLLSQLEQAKASLVILKERYIALIKDNPNNPEIRDVLDRIKKEQAEHQRELSKLNKYKAQLNKLGLKI